MRYIVAGIYLLVGLIAYPLFFIMTLFQAAYIDTKEYFQGLLDHIKLIIDK